MSTADHLKVPRQHGLFMHHGIDLGDGSVAHYLEGRKIIRSSLNDFCAGQTYSLVLHKKSSPNAITLRRAMSRIGEQSYNLLFNNCEHFANWCKTGKHRSLQMEDWLDKTSLGSIAFGQPIPAAIFSGLKLLIQKGLEDETSRQKAKEAIENLQNVREALYQKLEIALKELELWLQSCQMNDLLKKKEKGTQNLILIGQNISDQLNTVENLERKITNLLNQADYTD